MFHGWAPLDMFGPGEDPTEVSGGQGASTALDNLLATRLESLTQLPNLMITDWRGLGRWTDEQKNRPAQLVSCRALEAPPIAGAKTLLSTIFGYYLLDDKPAGAPTTFDHIVAREARRLGYDIFPTMHNGFMQAKRCVLWASADGRQATYALNLARREVATWWARLRADYGGWADGFHVDYLTTFEWLTKDPGYTAAYGIDGMKDERTFWESYNVGMGWALRVLRQDRAKPTLLLGQQFHNGQPPHAQMRSLNGRFCEQGPTAFGMTIAKHRALFNAWDDISQEPYEQLAHALELAEPYRWTSALTNEWLQLAVEFNSPVSWGRDDTGGLGWPTNA